MTAIAPEIFKAYDIRGIVDKSLTPATAAAIGRALGSAAREKNIAAIVVGRDGRLSGPALVKALSQGICASGVDVIDIGLAPTPVIYFAAHELGTQSCVAVTGSHNPPDYNGFKMVLGGQTLYGEMIQDLLRRITSADFFSPPRSQTPLAAPHEITRSGDGGADVGLGRPGADFLSPPRSQTPLAAPHGGADVGLGRPGADFLTGRGKIKKADVRQAYLDRIVGDVKLSRPMKLVVDCGNGVAGAFAPELFRRMGCEVIELFCAVDGTFPNHHPDPSKPENLADVRRALRETDAELGLAFDGDGDRLGVVTKDGEIIYPDRQLMLFAADVLSRNPGAQIIYDVKCSRWVAESIRYQGGRPLMWNTGHALIKTKLKETGAALAGEMSGHIFFQERWYGFDDGLYAGARLLEIVSRWPDAGWPLQHLPNALSTPELNLRMQEGEPHALIAKLHKDGKFPGARELIKIDGVRAEYADGFGLARASNTTPVIVLRFEADNATALARIQAEFKAALESVWPGLEMTFKHGH